MLPVAELADTADPRPTQQRFLAAFKACGSITQAAKRVGIDRQSHYDWLHAEGHRGLLNDDDAAHGTPYAHAFLLAKQQAADAILERSERHALSDAEDMPAVINRIFQIKRWYPQYRDQISVKHSGAVLNASINLDRLDPDERQGLLDIMARRLAIEAPETPPADDDDA